MKPYVSGKCDVFDCLHNHDAPTKCNIHVYKNIHNFYIDAYCKDETKFHQDILCKVESKRNTVYELFIMIIEGGTNSW